MSDDVRADGPASVGPLGAAMADLVDDAPDAGFTAWSVIGEVRRRRSVRRQVAGGLAAGVAAIGVLVTIGLVAVGGGGSDTATSSSGVASSSAAASSSSSSTAAAAGSAGSPSLFASATGSSTASGSSMASGYADEGSSASLSAAAESASGTPAPAPSVASGRGPASAPVLPSAVQPDDSGGDTATGSTAGCAALPLTPEQLTLIADRLPGLTPQASCATDDVELAVQDYTVDAVPGVTLRAGVRAGAFDPCAEVAGAVCVDVAGSPGVIFTEQVRGAARATLVWISSRAGSTVLTLTVPDGAPTPLTVDQLAAVVTELAATR